MRIPRKAQITVRHGASEGTPSRGTALALLAPDDRRQFAGKYVVIRLTGKRPGEVVCSGDTLEEIQHAARQIDGYHPRDFAVRHLEEV